MWLLCGLVTLGSLAAATPFPGAATFSPALSKRDFKVAPYSTDLKRKKHNGPHPRDIYRRQTVQTGSLIDDSQVRFLVPVTFGTQTFDMVLDTGSSDIWLAESGYACYSACSGSTFSNQEDPSYCGYTSTYTPDGDFTYWENTNFLDSYGAGCVAGAYGFVDVTIANLEVPAQSIGVASMITIEANLNMAGIVGCSPSTTGNSIDNFPSLLDNMFVADSFDPPLAQQAITFAISRDSSGQDGGGCFAIGGICDPSAPTVNASSDVYYVAGFDQTYNGESEYMWYGVDLDGGFYSDGNYYDTGTQVFVDSGNAMLDLPADIANAFNAQWSTLPDSNGNLPCDAVPGDLWIGIGGGWIQINPEDLIIGSGDACRSTVIATSQEPYWLGDPFFKNVMIMFRWDTNEVVVYPRTYYDS